jgi:hypothetical protein
MDDTTPKPPEISVSGTVPNEEAVFQISEGLEDCGYHGSAHIHFESRSGPGSPLIVRVRLEGRPEQQISIGAQELAKPKAIRKSVIDQLNI